MKSENKMRSERKLKQLKAAAWDAHIAKEAAITTRDTAWKAYLAAADAYNTYGIRPSGSEDAYQSAWGDYNAACDAYNAAGEAAYKAANVANAYEAKGK